MTPDERITKALEYAAAGGCDGEHHKQWVIDQMVRALTGCPMVMVLNPSANGGAGLMVEAQGESAEYRQWVADVKAGEDGPETYEWDTGIAP